MKEGILRRALPWLSLLAVGCASLQPEDAAPAEALQVDPAIVMHFPGAKAIADGIDRSGERELRDEDRLLLGVEVVLGEVVERHLLEVIVHRQKLGTDTRVATFTDTGSDQGRPLSIPQRHSRVLDLEFVLRTPEGKETQRTSLSGVPEFVLDESFVPAIQSSREQQPATFAVAVLRLVLVAQMLSDDPILQSLLQHAATVPLDISLLWRRELRLMPYFEQGRAKNDELAAYELPFDLFLNDSLLVRLVATVTEPHGAAGVLGGILGLRAQDARHPDRHLRVQVLGASRGPFSDWQRDGVFAAYGYADEGVGLAFSPDGRLVAMPGAGDDVELRDLTTADPSVATKIACLGRTVDLAYLDDDTLLVATEHHVQVFDVTDRNTPRLLATHEVPGADLCALEAVAADTLFVGRHGFGIARWRFATDRSAAPERQEVQAVQRETSTGHSTAADGTVTPAKVTWTRIPKVGWLLGVDADHVLARSDKTETDWRYSRDGAWLPSDLERVAEPASRRRRLPETLAREFFDRVTKGIPIVRSSVTGVHAFGAGPISLTGEGGTRMLNTSVSFRNFCHGFSADGRYYVHVAPGYRVFVDVERFLAGDT